MNTLGIVSFLRESWHLYDTIHWQLIFLTRMLDPSIRLKKVPKRLVGSMMLGNTCTIGFNIGAHATTEEIIGLVHESISTTLLL